MLPLLLSGCVFEVMTREDTGRFNVTVECEKGANVDVTLDLERGDEQKKTEVQNIP